MTHDTPLPSPVPPVGHAPALPLPSRRFAALWRQVLLYAAVAALSLGGAIWAMGVLHADLRVPFDYEGDAIFATMAVKTIVDKGWYLHNEDLGAPAGMMLYDFPAGDNLLCLALKGMSLFTSDPVLIVNLFFLATFPLIAITSLFTVRQFGVSAGPALLVSFLYALLPYHFWRGTAHLFFSAYFLVPPAILIAWWISSGGLLARRWRVWFSFTVCVLMGCSVPYYPFFACFLFVMAAAMALTLRRDSIHAVVGAVLVGTVVVVLLLNLLPNLNYMHTHGRAASGQRYSFESELAGLKIAQLLLPVSGHRIPALAALKANYNATHPLVNENDWVSLGFIGGAGFLVLIGWVLFIRLRPPEKMALKSLTDAERANPVAAAGGFGALIEHFSVFNAAAVLLATIGGFSALFSVLVSPQIRGFNRISTFIAFFSLLTVAVGLELVARRWVRTRPAAAVFGVVLAVLGLLGLLDQTGADAQHDWLALKRSFRNDKQYFARVQAALPPQSMVFQLPYEPFPEYGLMINQMHEYALFRPYVHTQGLRWSYGVIKGRPGDIWVRTAAAQPPEQMLKTLNHAGFAGIYIDRFGYADRAAALERQLNDLLGVGPLIDARGRFSFFKLPAPVGPPPSLDSLLPLPPPAWTNGFYDLETSADQKTNWHWCAADGEIHFFNDTQNARRVRLQATFRGNSPTPTPITLQIRGAGLQENLIIDPTGTAFSRTVKLPPGDTVLRFHCDAQPLPTSSTDPRTLVWRVDDFKMDNAD